MMKQCNKEFGLKLFLLAAILAVSSEATPVKRQAEFDSIGQVFHSIFGLFSTLGSEGGKFVAKQAEVNQPVVETVGDIRSTISRSDFVQSVRGAGDMSVVNGPRFLADNVNLASQTVGLVSSVGCAVLCPAQENCTYAHCLP